MRFFEAVDLLSKKAKTGYVVNGYDMMGNKFHIWTGPDFEEAKSKGQDAKFSGRAWRVEMIDPYGNPMTPAGGLVPRQRQF